MTLEYDASYINTSYDNFSRFKWSLVFHLIMESAMKLVMFVDTP